MPDKTYPATYRDQYGEESILIHNNGQEMRTTIRGVEIVTNWFFDDVEVDEVNSARLAIFGREKGYWWTLKCEIPITIVTPAGEIETLLGAEIASEMIENNRHGQYDLTLSLTLNKQYYENMDNFFFDNVMFGLEKKLPAGWYFKTCVNCYLSEPQPGGGPAFQTWGCFRNHRERLEWARSLLYPKSGMFAIWKEKTQWVQEIYLCDEFEPGS
jgi:hypothetical protein